MKLHVLGCWGNLTEAHRTVALLIDDRVLLDAGTVASALTVRRQRRISDVVLSHVHLDHVKELPFLVSNVGGSGSGPVRIHAPRRVLSGLRRHVFNGSVWPDFSVLPSKSKPFLRYVPLKSRVPAPVGGLTVTPVPVRHTVPCYGMLLERGRSAVLYSADTGQTEGIWRFARKRRLTAVLAEVSFPDRLSAAAETTGHLTPGMLRRSLEILDRPEVPVWVYHLKPEFTREIAREVARLPFDVSLLEQGATYRF